ncbi:hypothetical protein [Microvirga sp. 17 mud 1-3]|uniref:hypothetical protein n=1 Tax=Microvirga sp. 17 mud 1-3 TaxID=2082949 RepID=UPI000D6D3D0F|nr:hypothetical protein [Microvirga sp. 17 mud 1-3]AWM88148.1 hypothetical protein C4E04_16280 [Microvirga sp. 17 mud 1-3]
MMKPRPLAGYLPAAALALLASAIWPIASAWSQEGEDSPFADADMQPGRQARCSEVAALIEGRETGQQRVDFSVVGSLALVHHDGTLAYLGLCGTPPEPKVLCVTYQTNGMQVGDKVIVTGGFSKPSPDYVLLDPCLASRPEAGGE